MEKTEQFTEEELRDQKILWKQVNNITRKGNSAEVKRRKDGKLVVYSVKKEITEYCQCSG